MGDDAALSNWARDQIALICGRVQNSSAYTYLSQRLTPSRQVEADHVKERFVRPLGYDLIGLWAHLEGVSRLRATIDVGRRLNFVTVEDRDALLREIGEQFETVEDAADRRELVVDQRERVLHWRGERVDVDWCRLAAVWNFFATLVESAKSGGSGVDHTHFGEVDTKYVSKMVSRLRRQISGFPEGLVERIVPVGRGTYLLDIPAEQICLFQTREVLEEVQV